MFNKKTKLKLTDFEDWQMYQLCNESRKDG